MTALGGRPVFPADARGLADAARCLHRGGVIAIPTDTVTGLAVHARDPRPAERLAAVKGRPRDQPAILMAADADALAPYVRWTPAARGFAARHWPGPLTLILPATGAGRRLGGPGTVGVRVPGLPLLLGLLERSGPCATTSANRHREPPVAGAGAALDALPMLDGALEAPPGHRPGAIPSSILDCTADRPVLVRVGVLDAGALGLPGAGPGTRGSG